MVQEVTVEMLRMEIKEETMAAVEAEGVLVLSTLGTLEMVRLVNRVSFVLPMNH